MYREVKNQRFDCKLYLKVYLIALAVSAAFFLPFIISDRGIFLFYGDYNVQQIPFYQLAHRAIRSGDIAFNFYTDLGADFIGSYAFYLLGSPFFWLTIPFPNAALPYLMAPLFCLKFATAAVTACAFIKRFVIDKNYAVIGGLLYAFSGFSIYNIFFNHFHEVIALFPLLLLSLELFVTEKRRGVFALSVFICAFCNYYFFFGEVIFTAIYFFVRMASSKEWRIKFTEFLLLAFEAVIGLLLAAALLLPAINTVLSNPRLNEMLDGWYLLTYSNTQRYFAIIECFFFPPDIPARPNFFPNGNAKWSSLGAWLPMLGMCGVITFFQTHKKHFIRRMLGISIIIAFIPVLNSLFSALNDSYYARWFYMPILLMATATVIALENCTNKEFNTGIRWSLGITAIFTAVAFVPEEGEEEITLGLVPYPERLWLYVIIAFAGILLTAFTVNLWRKRKNGTKIITVLVCAMIFITAVSFIAQGKSHSYDEDYIIDNAIYGSEKINLEADENEFYRIDVYDGMDNMPMYWKLPSIQAFHSVVPESIMRFYSELDIERDVASRPEPDYYALRTLTGCKYLFIPKDSEDPVICYGFDFYDTQNEFDIYKNRYYVPMGWTYDYYCDETRFYDTAESFRDRLMVKAILLSDEQIEKYAQNMQFLSYDVYLAKSNMAEDTDDLRTQCASSFVTTNKGFESKITLKNGNLVFYSIPYSKGWSATVNGKEVQIEDVNNGLMAVWADAGENEIVFTYTTPGLYIGIIITIISAVILAVYLLIIKLYRKKHPVNSPNAEDYISGFTFGENTDNSQFEFTLPSDGANENIFDEPFRFEKVDDSELNKTEEDE